MRSHFHVVSLSRPSAAMLPRVIALGLLLGVGCDGAGTACNGSDALCERRYDEVAYATTHNAFATEADDFNPPNQFNTLTEQLHDGIRGFMLDVHTDTRGGGIASLCHGACVFGRRPLVDGLVELEDFLRRNPREVITIIFESYVPASDIRDAFEESGLLARTYAHSPGAPWPTLAEMIEADTRVVVLTDNEGGAYDWYMDVWAHAWETDYAAETPDDFSCDPNRGNVANPLFIFNHFLTAPLPAPALAEMVNHDPYLSDRLEECQTASGDFPNFVTVDFYEIGDVLVATDALNGL